MNPKEVQRFLRTMDALLPRREAYKHPRDDTDYVITLITEAIASGNNRTIDIFNHVKKFRGISHAILFGILNNKLDDLWIMSRSGKRTKHYHLIIDTE